MVKCRQGNEVLPNIDYLKPLLKADDFCNVQGYQPFFANVRFMLDFLTSFAVITLSSLLIGSILSNLKLPPLVAMLIVGIVLITAPLGAIAIDNLYKKLLTHDINPTDNDNSQSKLPLHPPVTHKSDCKTTNNT